MPFKNNEFVQVKLRVKHPLNEFQGRGRHYFIAVSGPGIQLGNEDPNIAPRCRLIGQNMWEKELWLSKESRIHYHFLIVHSSTGVVKDIETVAPRQLYIGHYPVTMEHVYNDISERKIIETNKKANTRRCQTRNRNSSYDNFQKSELRAAGCSANQCTTQTMATSEHKSHSEEVIKMKKTMTKALEQLPEDIESLSVCYAQENKNITSAEQNPKGFGDQSSILIAENKVTKSFPSDDIPIKDNIKPEDKNYTQDKSAVILVQPEHVKEKTDMNAEHDKELRAPESATAANVKSDNATDNIATDNVTTENVKSDNATDNTATDNATTENVTSDNATDNTATDNATTENVKADNATDNTATDNATTENVKADNATDNTATDNVTTENVKSDNATDNTSTYDVTTANVKSDNATDNTTTYNVTTANVKSDNATDNITTDNVTTANVKSDNATDNTTTYNETTENVKSDNATDNIATDNVTTENVKSDNATDNIATDDVTTANVKSDNATDNTTTYNETDKRVSDNAIGNTTTEIPNDNATTASVNSDKIEAHSGFFGRRNIFAAVSGLVVIVGLGYFAFIRK